MASATSAPRQLALGGILVALVAGGLGLQSLGLESLGFGGEPGPLVLMSSITPTIAIEPPAPQPAPEPAPVQPPKPTKGWAVDRVATPLGEVEVARVLHRAHVLELGKEPTKERLAVAWAHIALENARGEGIENNNFGNLTIWEREPGPHFVRILRERRPIKRGLTVTRWRWVEMRFKAFEAPVDGARAYWAHVRDHFPAALAQYDFEDGHGAGERLAKLGYASAFPMQYADSVANLTSEFKRRIAPELAASAPPSN